MKILIKGAGDLATGVAARLYGAGHSLLMTEIPEPLTVRRKVALSQAVYDGTAQVGEMRAVLAPDREAAEKAISLGDIAVMADPEAACRYWYAPDVVVDAIIAKRNCGTKITDAPLVIGVGPGFTAGEDCHCVIETKRGHNLGKVIWEGSAIPDTGVPGEVGGYTTERLIRASADGLMEPKAAIGDIVEKGRLVAVTGGCPVYAQIDGVVRGMLRKGVHVSKNLKIGDIDPRPDVTYCRTISDKAMGIGGGALEAVCRFERMKGRFAIVLLAAGNSDAASAERGETPLYEDILKNLLAFGAFHKFVVTGEKKAAETAAANGAVPVWCGESGENVIPLKRGLAAALEAYGKDLLGILFLWCVQPSPKVSTLQTMFNKAAVRPGCILYEGSRYDRTKPVLFGRRFFEELSHIGEETDIKLLTEKYSGNGGTV